MIDRLAVLGIRLDRELNVAGEAGRLSAADSAAEVLLLPTNEELAMAREIQEVITSELDLV